jgi:geranylgeranyl diphosphate synthase type I
MMSLPTPAMRQAIQDAMHASFPDVEARVARFYAMQQYHLGWRDAQLVPTRSDPGKLLRPYLVLLACQAVGGRPEQALPLAAGIQFVHDFTLIHDDIQDVSATRRGRATVWSLWGIAHGITAGDSMFVLAHLAVHRLCEAGVPAAVTLEVLRRFDETILAVCEGQYLDCSYEGNLDITEEDYLAMISRKTATLLGAATGLGALVGGADPTTVQALYDVGLNLGIAFQIQDDILGIWGDPVVTGKPNAADLYRRKVSLPIIRAIRNREQGKALARFYRQETISDADVWQMLAILDDTTIRLDMEAQVAHMAQATCAALEAVPLPSTPLALQAREQLAALLAAAKFGPAIHAAPA